MTIFESIRTDRLMNILIGVLSILTVCIWYVTDHNDLYFHTLTLYGGIVLGLYWSIFWWLQLMEHNRLSKDKKYQEELKVKKKIWEEVYKKRSVREELSVLSKSALIERLLIKDIIINIIVLLVAIPIGIIVLLVYSSSLLWIILISFILLIDLIRFILSIRELKRFNRELLWEEEIMMEEEDDDIIETSLDLSMIEVEDE